MKRLVKYFLMAFAIMVVAAFPVAWFAFELRQALFLSGVAGLVFGFFCSGLMERTLKTEVLVINASTKDPQKPLKWYEEQIRSTLWSMRFLHLTTEGGVEIYKPQGLYQIFESKISLEITPYEITLTASRMFCRIISDLLKPALYGNE